MSPAAAPTPAPRPSTPAPPAQRPAATASPGTPPAAPPSPPPRRWRPLGYLRRWLVSDDHALRLGVAGALTAAFVGIILYWSHGALLYGGDYIGIFTPGDFLVDPRSDYAIPSLVVLFLPKAPSEAFYLDLSIETFLSSYACQFFARQAFRRTFRGPWLVALGALASGFYLFSPVAITYWYIGLVTIVFVSTSAFFVVLGMFVKLLQSYSSTTPFRWTDAVILGIAAGCAAPDSIPNIVRVVAIALLIFLGAVLLGPLAAYGNPARMRATLASIQRVLVVSLPLTAALLFYPFYSFVTAPGFNLKTVNHVDTKYTAEFLQTTYTSFPLALRLLGREVFSHSGYNVQYLANNAVTVAGYTWPVLALVVPLILALLWRFPDRYLVLLFEVLAIPSVLWEAGNNPPAGAFHAEVAGLLPFGTALFQPYSVTLVLLSKLYPVLIAFSVIALASWIQQLVSLGATRRPPPSAPARRGYLAVTLSPFEGRPPRPTTTARLVTVLFVVGLALLVAYAAQPIYDGEVERPRWAPTVAGFELPPVYYQARQMVLNDHGGNLLVLPEISTYFRTTWDYDAANGFYTNFFYPAQAVVPRFYGNYALYVNSSTENYTLATNPIAPAGNLTPQLRSVTYPWNQTTVLQGGGGIKTSFVESNGAWLSAAGKAWLRVVFNCSSESTTQAAITAGDLWIGLQTYGPNATKSSAPRQSWYALGQDGDAHVESENNTTLTVDLLLSVVSSGGVPFPGQIGGIEAWYREPVSSFGLITGVAQVGGYSGTGISQHWISMMHVYGVGYLLVDHSVTVGSLETVAQVNNTEGVLNASGFLGPPLLNTTMLSLYPLNLSAPGVTDARTSDPVARAAPGPLAGAPDPYRPGEARAVRYR